ncbi:MAG: hypothetical protein U9N81_13690 [Bacillota bacterium]|nr:hypothetical protein [Bacillota bacterium]
MNHMRVLSLTLLVFVSVLLFSAGIANAEDQKIERVILISVAGYNYEAYVSVPAPNIRYLISDGVINEKTLAVRSDTLEAAEASILTGALTESHKHYTTNDRVEVESICELLKKQGKTILVVDGSGGKLQSFSHGDKEYIKMKTGLTSKEILEQVSQTIGKSNPFFTYIYIDDCANDLLSLKQDVYYESIKNFDFQLGEFLGHLKHNGLYDNSLIIVTSARSSSPSDMVPLIIHGPGCRSNGGKTQGVMVIDVVPTICDLLHLETPVSARGIPAFGAMSVEEDDKARFFNHWINELLVDRIDNWNMNYQLNDQLQRTIHQMNSIKEEKQSFFDFAGEREQLIAGLQNKLTKERCFWGALIVLMLMGYVLEYVWLKRRFLLFK